MVKRTASSCAAFLLLILSLSLFSCAKKSVQSFPWRSPSGQRLEFFQKDAFAEAKEGIFSPTKHSNLYTLKSPLPVPKDLMVEVELDLGRGGAEIDFLVLGGIPGTEKRYAFMLPPGRIKVYLPVGAETLNSIGVEVRKFKAVDAEGGKVVLASLAVSTAFHGYDPGDKNNPARISSSFSLQDRDSGGSIWTIDIASMEDPSSALLHLSYGPGEGKDLILGIDARPRLSLSTLPQGRRTSLPLQAFAAPGKALQASAQKLFIQQQPGADLRSAYVERLAESERILVDPGYLLLTELAADQVLSYFFWDANPEVGMLVFKDYATQDAYLKRLAFFVEKKGFLGRLARDEEIASLHGWNAHDYRAEDLARFFSEAAKLDFPLNPQEKWLEGFLESTGIIVRHGSLFSPGKGAFISISQESPAYLRRLFLVHELSHAIFFTDQGYRDLVMGLWASMSREERYFWLLYLGWMNYETRSDYLMANEMQSYLVQQGLGGVKKYFTETLPKRLLENHPELEEKITQYMDVYGDEFLKRARILSDWLGKSYGVKAGSMHFLRRLN